MTISEATRREMHTRLVDVLGTEAADTLMAYLPPVGWTDVATKRDLDVLATKKDLEIYATKKDLEAFASKRDLDVYATKKDLEAVEARLRGELTSSFERFETRITDKLNQQTRSLLIGVSAMMAATISAVASLVALSR